MYKNQNGQFSPPSTSVVSGTDECNESDITNAFYCLPSSTDQNEDRSSASSTANVNWWDDVQQWHAALWRAAMLRSAFNVACSNSQGHANRTNGQVNSLNGPNEQKRIKNHAMSQLPILLANEAFNVEMPENFDEDEDGESTTHKTTLMIMPEQDEPSDTLQNRQIFLCNLPTKLVNGQQIQVAIGNLTFNVTVKATTYKTPATSLPSTQNDKTNTIMQKMMANNLCKEWENNFKKHPSDIQSLATKHGSSDMPKLPLPSTGSLIDAIRFRNCMPIPHKSWPLPEISHSNVTSNKSMAYSFYDRKRPKSRQTSNHRQKKREISIARVVSPEKEKMKIDGHDPFDGDFSEESTIASRDNMQSTVDGVNLEEIKRFAKLFKMKRLSLGLTQTQVGQTLSLTNGPAYSQSAICRFEKLDITPKSAQKIKPVLERWLQEVDDQIKINGGIVNMQTTFGGTPTPQPNPTTPQNNDDFISIPQPPPSTQSNRPNSPLDMSSPEKSIEIGDMGLSINDLSSPEPVCGANCSDGSNCKRRKRRTSFTPQALEILNDYFERNSHPSGMEMTSLAERLNYEREVIRVWFCNKRQALKNTFKKLKTS